MPRHVVSLSTDPTKILELLRIPEDSEGSLELLQIQSFEPSHRSFVERIQTSKGSKMGNLMIWTTKPWLMSLHGRRSSPLAWNNDIIIWCQRFSQRSYFPVFSNSQYLVVPKCNPWHFWNCNKQEKYMKKTLHLGLSLWWPKITSGKPPRQIISNDSRSTEGHFHIKATNFEATTPGIATVVQASSKEAILHVTWSNLRWLEW